MTISRVWIEEGCICCALSELECPEIFKVNMDLDTAVVIENVDFSKYEEQIKKAADSCPSEVIKYE